MSEDQLSVTFAALADPTRRAILARLAQGEASVTELAKPFDLSLPGVSKHLKVLQRAGLITQSRNAQWRPCRLEGGRFREASEWVGEYRRFWDESFQRLDDVLQDLIKEKETNDTEGRNQDGEDGVRDRTRKAADHLDDHPRPARQQDQARGAPGIPVRRRPRRDGGVWHGGRSQRIDRAPRGAPGKDEGGLVTRGLEQLDVDLTYRK